MSAKAASNVSIKGSQIAAQNQTTVLCRCSPGDKWVLRCLSPVSDYSMTIEFVGEEDSGGRNLYIMRVSFGPGAAGRPDHLIVHVDLATLFPVKIQFMSEHIGLPVTVITAYDDHFPGALPYPLDTGKQFEVVQTETTTYSVDGDIPVETQITTAKLMCKVETMEEVTVPTGTFNCVKVTKYDQKGNALGVSWKSDEVGHAVDVKYVDYLTGEVWELVSYPERA